MIELNFVTSIILKLIFASANIFRDAVQLAIKIFDHDLRYIIKVFVFCHQIKTEILIILIITQ